MRIGAYECHPAAALFPLLAPADLEKLAADIEEHGQLEPVLVAGQTIIDGRNRLLACELRGVSPRVVEWGGTGSVVVEIISRNLHRRHLTESQRALIAAEGLPALMTEARERQRRGGRRHKEVSATGRGGDQGKAAAMAARAVGVGTRTVERARRLTERAPALVERVRAGELTLGQAEREIRIGEANTRIAEYRPPAGRYQVIVIDPPWRYEDELEGPGVRGGLAYPSMGLEEICALQLPMDADCAVWIWVTNPLILDGQALQVPKAWGLTPRALLTWDKERIATGHWLRGVTEHAILATRGRPVIRGERSSTLIREPRREHSRKPEAFWRLVEEVTPAPEGARLEMFSREPRPGWITSGAEGELFGGHGE